MKSLIREIKLYKKELKMINEELQILPTGRLAKKGTSYYHVINKKEIGITRNKGLIRSLCRKKYLLSREKQLSHNISIISRTRMSELDETTPIEMIKSLPSAYQGMPDEYFFHPSVVDFFNKTYKKNPHQPEEWVYFSKNGVPVRSKSEVLIANQLEDYGIPYRYDIAIALGKQTKYPDFTIKNPFNGQLILWEHFGALNQFGYEQKMNDKMSLYMQHGYLPFETIIYTFEFDVRSTRRLQYLIEHIIL